MTSRLVHRLVFAALLVSPALVLVPTSAKAWVAPPGIDKIALDVMEQRSMAKTGSFDPYLKQLGWSLKLRSRGRMTGKRKGMNRFLEMLGEERRWNQHRGGPSYFCHGRQSGPLRPCSCRLRVKRSLDSDEKALVDRMKRFAASIRDQDERAALSF